MNIDLDHNLSNLSSVQNILFNGDMKEIADWKKPSNFTFDIEMPLFLNFANLGISLTNWLKANGLCVKLI